MGAPKQKWTSEEEAALKAGVVKHGAGKWRTILKDPQFSGILSLRSNVDLKDKWRNMSVTANGWGSREKARVALKRSHQMYKNGDDDDDHDGEDDLALSTVVQSDEEVYDVKPLAMTSQNLQINGPKKSLSRLENLILEAISSLNEPTGSNKTTIGIFIEDQYDAPPNFKKILSAKLKSMTANKKLIKVKRKYRIAPRPRFPSDGGNPGMLGLEGVGQRDIKPDITVRPTKIQVDADLAKMRNMTAEEAAAAAARAVAEAEASIAEAEEAAREADAADVDAEEAQAFAEAALMTLRNRNASKMVILHVDESGRRKPVMDASLQLLSMKAE
ncbi:telomere repeat-binding factor 1-like isoform X1 [Papaver somniferum]|uniref:telomere repeat-binding factor 1-like isoform X1 n=1 Tax=Papaver somniferum TaxID=3469 RepID=UPI000E6F8515|nr:telomere repeat-binding factor 1-like isoform X1 [Papaver somniferum]